APITGAHDLSANTHHETAPKPFRSGLEQRTLETAHRFDRPVSRVLAGARRDGPIHVARVSLVLCVFPSLFAQEAQHGIQGCQADGAVTQTFRVQPVLVEAESIGKNIGDALVKAGDKDATDPGFTHASGPRAR